jgi:hypothetical protein
VIFSGSFSKVDNDGEF